MRTLSGFCGSPLDDDFGRTVESSLVLHVVGDQGLSRGGTVVRRLTVQDVGELSSRDLEKLGAKKKTRRGGRFWR